MPTYEGRLDATGLRIALLASRFNETITKSLLEGALSALRRHGLDDASITVAWVPGAFELPLTAKRLADSGEFDAIVCLGAVIRGATSHYDYVCSQAATGIARVSLDGAFVAEVDTYSATEEIRVPVFTARGLAPGTHTLMIEVTGRKNAASTNFWILVDAFDVGP